MPRTPPGLSAIRRTGSSRFTTRSGARVEHIYNDDTGNLIRVLKLVDRTAGTYATNIYHYDNANFPHYITEIDDPRGIPAARNLYDDSGRLIGMIDADGRTNTITHDLTGRKEQIVDHLGNTNTYAYDTHGNVTQIVNALNETNSLSYDDCGCHVTLGVNALNQTNQF